MKTSNPASTSPALDALLARAERRVRWLPAAIALVQLISYAAAAVLCAMLLDAACPLPAWALRAERMIFVGPVIGYMVFLWRVWREPAQPPAALARMLETRLGLAPSALSNAVDLQASAPAGASSTLCAEAIRQGEAAAQALPPQAVKKATDTGHLRRAAQWLAAVLLLCALVFGLFPNLLKAGLSRLIHPSAGFAAYTPLHFEVAITPNPVIEGDPASIRAAITGTGVPDEAWLVFLRGAAGVEVDERVPMPLEIAGQEQGPPAGQRAGHFAAVLDHPAQTRRFYIETARGRSEVLTLSVLALPRVEAVSAVLRPPAYTGWPETKQRVGPAGIDLLEGGEAQFQIDCSMPVPGARVRFTPDGGKPVESACQADPKNDRRLLLAWLATASGELEVTPRNAAGLAARAPLHLRVTALPDAPPSIHVTDPEPLLYAPEGDRVTVRVSASDDVAVAKVLTLRAANNWGPFASPVAFKPSPDAGRVTGEFTFDLGALGAKAGDVIKYCAVAEDGRPEAAGAQNAVKGAAKRGPQRAQSDTQAIRVISRQEYLRHLREERRVAEITEEAHRIQDALAALKTRREEALQAEQVAAEIIREKSEKGQPLTDADRAALAKASEKTAAFAKAAKEAADRAAKRAKEPAAYGFEKKYLEDMAKMADQLKEQAILADDADNAAKEAAAGKDAKAQQRMREALDRFRDKHEPFGDQSELKQDTQGLDKLAATDALKSLQDDLKALALDQAELEKDLARFNRRESLNEEEKLQAAQLGKRQKDLRRQLADITGEMQQVLRDDGDKIPKQAAKARDLLNNLMGEAVAQDMDDAGTLAEAGDGRMAHAAAASAAEKLLRLLKPSAKDDNEDEDAKDDLEDALGMDEGALGECLGQMGEARGAGEGQSSGTGQGEGRGKGRGRGRGHGQGASQADGGGEGRTHGRKSVKAAVHGAQGDSQGKSGASDGRGKGAGHGQGAGNGGDAAHATPAENIEAGADAGRDAKGTPMPGVPPVYRGLTEQYFKRVLEDSNKNNGGQP